MKRVNYNLIWSYQCKEKDVLSNRVTLIVDFWQQNRVRVTLNANFTPIHGVTLNYFIELSCVVDRPQASR